MVWGSYLFSHSESKTHWWHSSLLGPSSLPVGPHSWAGSPPGGQSHWSSRLVSPRTIPEAVVGSRRDFSSISEASPQLHRCLLLLPSGRTRSQFATCCGARCGLGPSGFKTGHPEFPDRRLAVVPVRSCQECLREAGRLRHCRRDRLHPGFQGVLVQLHPRPILVQFSLVFLQ